MKVVRTSKEELVLENRPPLSLYLAALGVLLVAVVFGLYYWAGPLFFFMQTTAAAYLAYTVLEDVEVITFSLPKDTVTIARVSPLGRRSVTDGRLSEIVSVRLDEHISQMTGKMTRPALLFESGVFLPLSSSYSTLPQEFLVQEIDKFLEEISAIQSQEWEEPGEEGEDSVTGPPPEKAGLRVRQNKKD